MRTRRVLIDPGWLGKQIASSNVDRLIVFSGRQLTGRCSLTVVGSITGEEQIFAKISFSEDNPASTTTIFVPQGWAYRLELFPPDQKVEVLSWIEICFPDENSIAVEEGQLKLRPFNQIANDGSNGYADTTSGFVAPNPNVGTYTRTFTFGVDPLQIISTSGQNLATISTIKASISKALNPDTSITGFAALSWNAQCMQRNYSNEGVPFFLSLLDINGAALQKVNMGNWVATCGAQPSQSLVAPTDPTYYDRSVTVILQVAEGNWIGC